MLSKLGWDGRHIIEVDLSEDKKTLTLTEACDLYYEAKLSKEEVKELIKDFTDLYSQMI